MKVSISNSQLLPALKNLVLTNRLKDESIESYFSLTVVGNKVKLFVNDGVISVSCHCLSETTISDKKVTGILPLKAVFDICKTVDKNSDIKLDIGSDKVKITIDGAMTSIPVRHPLHAFEDHDRTVYPLKDISNRIEVDTPALLACLNNTAFAMAKGDTRFYLNGLLLDFTENALHVVATDGHRLSKDTVAIDKPLKTVQAILPDTSAKALIKFLKASGKDSKTFIYTSTFYIEFITNGQSFITELIDGKFPDYTRVMPRHSTNVITLNRKLFLQTLKQVEPFSNEKYKGMQLTFNKGKLTVYASNPNGMEIERTLPCEFEGDKLEIGFNLVYIKQALTSIKDSLVTFSLSDKNSSGLIREASSDSSRELVVMPMRL